jgi:hypothetical protein
MSTTSQRDRLLALLKRHRGEWVALPQVQDAGGAQYNARIYELRGLGHRITNSTQEVDEVRRSWFRLEIASAPTRPISAPTEPTAPESTATLFGAISPDRSYRE